MGEKEDAGQGGDQGNNNGFPGGFPGNPPYMHMSSSLDDAEEQQQVSIIDTINKFPQLYLNETEYAML